MLPRVLLVDDEPKAIESICKALASEPFEVITASSGAEALAIMARSPADIVVSDERMPEMGGVELLCRIKLLSPTTTRILLTGQASVEAAMRAINEARIFRFLIKPCHPHELIGVLSAAMSSRAAAEYNLINSEATARFERILACAYLVFQPIINSFTQQVHAYEALLRSDDDGLVTPDKIIALASELRREDDLEHKVIQLAAAALRRGPPDVPLFVNIHPSSLLSGWLTAPTCPLRPYASRVVLEVNERASLHELGVSRDDVAALRAAGYRLAVDDLGAGFSGLTSFVMLQPDVAKVDMHLIRSIDTDPVRSKLVESMVWLCRELKVSLICEGVETTSESMHLQGLGCSLMQGYLFARPSRDCFAAASEPKRPEVSAVAA